MLLVPMSVHSLLRYFQLVSAHAFSSTVHDSPRKFRTKTLKRALQFLPHETETAPSILIDHFEWGLRGVGRNQFFPPLPKAKAKAKAQASESSSISDRELFGENSSDAAE